MPERASRSVTLNRLNDDTMTQTLISPYGGPLVNLRVPEEARAELKAYASTLPSLQSSERAACDLELLATGGFSPLDRFMGRLDHERVVGEMRLHDGHIFPIPLTLPIDDNAEVHLDKEVALRSQKNDLLAILRVEEV